MSTDPMAGVFDDGGSGAQSTATAKSGFQSQQQADGMYGMPDQITQNQHEHQQQYQQDSHMQQQQQGAILGDWFYGGQQMLGILEQPMFDFEL